MNLVEQTLQLPHQSTEKKKNRKNVEWKTCEDEILKKQIKKFQGNVEWNEVAKAMQQMFKGSHQFNSKACKDRYNHYLKEGLNHGELTQQEIEKLVLLTKTHGKQWSIIAKSMNNRTEQFVKNKFYALVKKILRTLHLIFKKTRNSSSLTNQLRPSIISKFLCGNEDDDQITLEEKQIRILAQDIVFNNLKITKSSQLDQSVSDKLSIVLEFMNKQNSNYINELKEKKNKTQSQVKKQGFSCFPSDKIPEIPPSIFGCQNFNIFVKNITPELKEEITASSNLQKEEEILQAQSSHSICQSFSISNYINFSQIQPSISNGLKSLNLKLK